MGRYISLLLFIGLVWGQDCTADDGTEGVELWGECYSIENTTVLDLSWSGLTGQIPPDIGTLTNLIYLYLSWNELSGQIPPEIGNLINLINLNLGNNQMTGEIPSEIGNLTNIGSLIDLSYNQLTGEIPPEIGNLTNIDELKLSYNQFTGEIPSEIGNLTNLTGLWLDNNGLTGEIPESICSLTNLNWSSEWINFGYSYIYNNQLCPSYPECIEDYVGEQDTTNCVQVSIMDETFPLTYKLHSAYPNPFNPVATLNYDLPENELVNITIYDMMGRVVKTLINDQQTAGYKSIQWNANNNTGQPVSAGLYLYMIQAGEFRQTKKMVLLK